VVNLIQVITSATLGRSKLMNKTYYDQINLLLTVLPSLAEIDDFALKGGTAINLFFRDMPRLSVDIDLALIKLTDRDQSISIIDTNLKSFAQQITQRNPGIRIIPKKSADGYMRSLLVENSQAQIKVEVNDIIRGSVHPCELKELCTKAQDQFEKYAEIQTYSFNDLFAGKICAALDRQHPRDLFDVKLLLEEGEFSEALRKTFIVYLISHNRPISELINPNRLNITEPFKNNFEGMTAKPVTQAELEEAREEIIKLTQNLSGAEKEFLISFKSGKPQWDLLGLVDVDKLPAVRWKLINISKMSNSNYTEALEELKQKLGY
jgi:predicted nucleotidyltransferase component of viral defense system